MKSIKFPTRDIVNKMNNTIFIIPDNNAAICATEWDGTFFAYSCKQGDKPRSSARLPGYMHYLAEAHFALISDIAFDDPLREYSKYVGCSPCHWSSSKALLDADILEIAAISFRK